MVRSRPWKSNCFFLCLLSSFFLVVARYLKRRSSWNRGLFDSVVFTGESKISTSSNLTLSDAQNPQAFVSRMSRMIDKKKCLQPACLHFFLHWNNFRFSTLHKHIRTHHPSLCMRQWHVASPTYVHSQRNIIIIPNMETLFRKTLLKPPDIYLRDISRKTGIFSVRYDRSPIRGENNKHGSPSVKW